MSGLAVSMVVVICGSVWGGFVLLLARAVRQEKAKAGREPGSTAR